MHDLNASLDCFHSETTMWPRFKKKHTLILTKIGTRVERTYLKEEYKWLVTLAVALRDYGSFGENSLLKLRRIYYLKRILRL